MLSLSINILHEVLELISNVFISVLLHGHLPPRWNDEPNLSCVTSRSKYTSATRWRCSEVARFGPSVHPSCLTMTARYKQISNFPCIKFLGLSLWLVNPMSAHYIKGYSQSFSNAFKRLCGCQKFTYTRGPHFAMEFLSSSGKVTQIWNRVSWDIINRGGPLWLFDSTLKSVRFWCRFWC